MDGSALVHLGFPANKRVNGRNGLGSLPDRLEIAGARAHSIVHSQ
jgi:hypothetical protein